MTSRISEKSKHLFCAARALEETWLEVDRLVEALDNDLTKKLTGDGNDFASVKRSGFAAHNFPEQTMWSYQYNFRIFKRGRGRRIPGALLCYEFRLCWPHDHKIISVDGSEAKVPLIIVKGTNDKNFIKEMDDPNGTRYCCYDIFTSPTERTDIDELDYHVTNRLVWDHNPDSNHWYGVFALPLFAINNEDDVKRELVNPACELVTSWSKDADALENKIFSQCTSILRWREGKEKEVLLDSNSLTE